MIIAIIIGIILLLIDILFKTLSIKKFKIEEKKLLKEHIVFTYVENSGAMFGIFDRKPILVKIISSICLIGIIALFIIFYQYLNYFIIKLGFMILCAGAISNESDRIIRGHVIDFIYFKIGKRNTYVFNFGDFYIFIGIILVIIGGIIYE